MKRFLGVLIAAVMATASTLNAEITVNTNFAGANCTVEKIDGQTITVHQQLRDTKGWWFYWCFEVNGAAGKTITVKFTDSDPIEANGPAYSLDGSKTWKWLGKQSVRRDKKSAKVEFTHKIPDDAKSVRYCLAYPYLLDDFTKFANEYKQKGLTIKPLALTKQKRQNIFAAFGNPDGKYKILLTARHHACESSGSYVLEGFLREALSDSESGKFLRANADFMIVPLVDIDGVQNGDQGKNRIPYDHNRDYYGTPIYPSVAAIKKISNDWRANKRLVAIDFHSPWIGRTDDRNRRCFFSLGAEDANGNIEKFSKMLQDATKSEPLKHFTAENVPYGVLWNTSKLPRSFKAWAAGLDNVEFATTLETPYSEVSGAVATDKTLKGLGATVARTLANYLREANK